MPTQDRLDRMVNCTNRKCAVVLLFVVTNFFCLRSLRFTDRIASLQGDDSHVLVQHLLQRQQRTTTTSSMQSTNVTKTAYDKTGANNITGQSALRQPQTVEESTSMEQQGNIQNEINSSTATATADSDSSPPNTPKRLNILILYPDDMRHDSLSIAGTQAVQTPFLDSLARSGMRFTHNCVTTSICWISRANLFTGQYVSRHKASTLRAYLQPDAWNKTWPAILRRSGYYIGHIGKWQYYDSGMLKHRYDYARVYEGKHTYGNLHVTDRNEQDAMQFLRKSRNKSKPFVLQIAFYAPKAVGTGDMQWTPKNSSMHLYQNLTFKYPGNLNESLARLPAFHNNNRKGEARRRWQQRFGTPAKFDASMKAYYRMITELDECSRNVVAEIERQGLLNETMIIFTTDNGFFHSEHGLSGKWFPYEESIRVPLIIWDPRMPQNVRGTTSDEFTLNIDLAETILGAAGLAPDPGMQGRDIADLYLPDNNSNSSVPWRKEFYYEFPGQGSLNIVPAANAVIRKDYKLFHYPEYDLWQLFNLQEDPLEEFDLIEDPKYAQLVVELKQRYEEMKLAVK